MTVDIERVYGVIFDLDNTLYRFTDEFYRACNLAAAAAAQEMGISLSYEDTLKLAERSEQEYGYSMHGYVTDHGLSYASLHFPFHQKIDETVIEKIDGIQDAFSSFTLPKVILTNASRDWAERVLKHIGLDHIFSSDAIIPMEDANFEPKSRTAKGFKKAQKILNLPAENILMIDDLDRNLIIPSDLGMQTAYINHNDPIQELPDFIDEQFETVLDLIKILKA